MCAKFPDVRDYAGVELKATDVDWGDGKSVTAFVGWCIVNDCVERFYKTYPWQRVRAEVMTLDHGECQLCKARGLYSPAKVAHHINYLRNRPDLALCIWYVDAAGQRRRNIIAVCNDCHEAEHKRLELLHQPKREPVTPERW